MMHFAMESAERAPSYSAITSLNSASIRRISSEFDLPRPLTDTDIALRDQLEGAHHTLVGFVPISRESEKLKIKSALLMVDQLHEADYLDMSLFPFTFTDSPDQNGLWLYLNPKFTLTKSTLRLEVSTMLDYAAEILDTQYQRVLARRRGK